MAVLASRSTALRRALTLLVFLVTLSVAGSSILNKRQLGGLLDEWMYLGAHLTQYRTLGFEGQPTVFRPPGYPAFISGLMVLFVDPPKAFDMEYLRQGARVVYWAQAVLLAATATLLFLWLCRRFRPGIAAFGALWFGTNAYAVVLAGLLHYAVLHLLLLVVCCYTTELAAAEAPPGIWRWARAGIVWGVSTLVRPVSLLWPPFLAVLCGVRFRKLAPAGRALGACLLGMLLVVAPWTLRNAGLTSHLIPVNAQAWTALWRMTVAPWERAPNHYNWYSTIHTHYEPMIAGVTGSSTYNYDSFVRHVVEIEAVARAETFRNLRTQPKVYLHNCLTAFLSFNLDLNTVLVQVFEHLQTPGATYSGSFDWFMPGNPQDFHSKASRRWLSISFSLMTAAAFAGAWYGWRRRDPFLVVPGIAYACVMSAHVFVYMDMPYYYVKLPFVAVFACALVDSLSWRGPGALTVGDGLAVGLLLGSVATTTRVLV